MDEAAKECAAEYLESGIDIENVEFCQAQIYVATVLIRDRVVKAGMAKIIPARYFKKGPKP